MTHSQTLVNVDSQTEQVAGQVIKRLVHQYLLANREQLLATATALDREYLRAIEMPTAADELDSPRVTGLIVAVANAFIDEGLRQTS